MKACAVELTQKKPAVGADVLSWSLLFFLLMAAEFSCAQSYVRTQKNIGLFASAYFPEWTKSKQSASCANTGFAIGLTKKVGGIFYPELFFSQRQSAVLVPSARQEWEEKRFTLNSAGAGLLAKINLVPFGTKKKKGYCFGRMLNFILGSEFIYALPTKPVVEGVKANNEFAAKLGLGMYSYWSGSSKKHQAWTIHWDLVYRRGLNPFMQTDFGDRGVNTYKRSSLALTCRIMHHKIYKFSEM